MNSCLSQLRDAHFLDASRDGRDSLDLTWRGFAARQCGRKSGHGGVFEKQRDRRRHLESIVNSGKNLRRYKRLATQREKVLVHANFSEPE
jgi:hypothetical protein